MLENIVIPDGALSQLAARRAQAVREKLLAGGKVEPDRIFLVKPQSLIPQQKEKAKDSRVDFTLK
jgi:flagellar motor protein MotB